MQKKKKKTKNAKKYPVYRIFDSRLILKKSKRKLSVTVNHYIKINLPLTYIHSYIMAQSQVIFLVVAFAILFVANTSVNGQCYTACFTGGCCSAALPQCCNINGVKLCCPTNHAIGRTTEMDIDQSTSSRYNLLSD
ncbi:unnamed protein product [Rotaria socialis]|uniref:Uncharacterized protein n=1 Tax=Rotaria socialis TaxID=392032 RepID=A0A818HKT3_9BILA|nr:unnamed protein product [Rotaria socialis]